MKKNSSGLHSTHKKEQLYSSEILLANQNTELNYGSFSKARVQSQQLQQLQQLQPLQDPNEDL